MVVIALKVEHLDKDVVEFIYDKQLEFRKANGGRVYSAERTINRLLKEAYCKKEEETQTDAKN